MISGQLNDEEAQRAAREIQNASFMRRSSTPMIFQLVYWLFRLKLEKRMGRSAREYVEQYTSTH